MTNTAESITPAQRALFGIFGIARKAGFVAQGMDAAMDALRSGAAQAVFLASDCAERTLRNARRIAAECGAQALDLPCTRAQLGHAIGCPPTGVAAIQNRGLAQKACALLAAQRPAGCNENQGGND